MRKLEGDEGRELAGRVVVQALQDLSSPDILRFGDALEWFLFGDGCLWAECLNVPPRQPEDVLSIMGGAKWLHLARK